MGLQSQLNDVGSDSIPILLLATIAACVSHLRTLLIGLCHTMGLSRLESEEIDDQILGLSSGLAGLIVLSEQLNLNDGCSYRYRRRGTAEEEDDDGGVGCVFCLCGLSDGDRVRRLTCRHVFHKECLDGWLDQMKFNCPLCRSPLVSDWRVDQAERRVGGELATWFADR